MSTLDRRFPAIRMAVDCVIGSIKPCLHVAVVCASHSDTASEARNREVGRSTLLLKASVRWLDARDHFACCSCCLFFLIFAILGMQLFGGTFHACYVSREPPLVLVNVTSANITDWLDCIGAGYEWLRPQRTFDNVGLALGSLVECATFENWLEVMDFGIDGTGPGIAPKPMSQLWVVIYFLMILLVGGFFVLNIFTGVVIDNFTKIKANYSGRSLSVTEDQQLWVDGVWVAINTQPRFAARPPLSRWRRKLFRLVVNDHAESCIILSIVINIAIMATVHYNQAPIWDTIQGQAGSIFNWVFAVEAVLKIGALDILQYFQDPYNRADFVIALVGLVSEFTEFNGRLVSTLRLVRVVVRVIRVVSKAPWARDVRKLLVMVTTSLPSLASVGCLLALLYCIFAILGRSFFWNVKHGVYFNEHANFENFGTSFVTLFRFDSLRSPA